MRCMIHSLCVHMFLRGPQALRKPSGFTILVDIEAEPVEIIQLNCTLYTVEAGRQYNRAYIICM